MYNYSSEDELSDDEAGKETKEDHSQFKYDL